MTGFLILGAAGIYLYLLFAVAFHIDSRAREPAGPAAAWVFALSLAVYCTSWSFYGSVGRAAVSGITFMAVHLGPLLVFVFAQAILRKIARIVGKLRVTSIADFISARYGKSQGLAGLVTVIAVLGIMPYISLQLKAVSTSFDILSRYPDVLPQAAAAPPLWADSALYVALAMALFVIIFGTRRVDATEQHRGMVTAVALESLVKLAAFLAVGIFVAYGMFDGVADLFARAGARADLAPLLDFGRQTASTEFWTVTALSAMIVVCLPRQFQISFVECTDASHFKAAGWIFPIYLVAIDFFVLPIALAGKLAFAGQDISADTYVLALPIAAGSPWLAGLAFIGGLSAATGMIIVEAIALSTMICNDLAMPLLIRGGLLRVDRHDNVSGLVKGIRRAAILFVLLLGYTYQRLVGESYALVSIGLVSFCAAAQFGPAMLGGIFWRRGSRSGALAGLACGFLVWAYTLLLPSFARSGWLPAEFAEAGAFGIEALRPYALLGLDGLDPVSHSLFWSLLANVGAYVLFSLAAVQGSLERSQAQAFAEVEGGAAAPARSWDGEIRVGDVMALLERFVDRDRASRAYADYARASGRPFDPAHRLDRDFVHFAEHLLSGAIGAALARVVMASAIREKQVSMDGVIEMLSGASQAIETNWEMTREALENIPQGVSMFDAGQRLLVWNRRFFELLGLPDHLAAIGTPFEDFVRFNAARGEYGPGDVEALVAERLRLADRREAHLFERERPDGTAIEVRGKPLPGGGFITTYTDITERKRAERQLKAAYDELERRVAERTRDLRESEQRFRDLAESASDWFWETDADLRFTYISERFFEITVLRPADVIGKRRWEVLGAKGGGRSPEDWRGHRRDMEARRGFKRFEFAIPAPEGEVAHIRVSGKPFYDAAGAFLGYRGTGTDITELMLTQNELVRSEKLAALGGLVAGVAHEINTPVGIGLTAASYLAEQVRELEKSYGAGALRRSDIEAFIRSGAEASDSLVTNLRRAAELVRSFKQVAVDQSSEMKRRFNLKGYLDEILLSLHPKLKRTRHAVEVDCPEDIEIDSYPGAFSQILTNLVMNSLIHGLDGVESGVIAISAERGDGELILRYSDNGKGMAPDLMQHMFEPFFTTRRGQGGSGLGLHLVYNLVNQTLRGRIDAASQPGQGLSFTLRIPVEKENSHERAES